MRLSHPHVSIERDNQKGYPLATTKQIGNNLMDRIPRYCDIDGCENIHKARGFCSKHYTRDLRLNPTSKRVTKHGYSKSPEYRTWRGMKTRCYNANSREYANYGGRGIVVCSQWKDSFSAFIDYVGPKPSAKHSLDRINNDGNYEPGNVRWVTIETQANNKSSNHTITYNSVQMSTTQWAKLKGIGRTTLQNRLNKGWDIARALETPVKVQRSNGKCKISGCDKKHDAKGYCSKHYYFYVAKPRKSQ